MNAKKLLALLLALVLCLGALAGCNSDPKETTQSTTKATEGTTAATTQAATEATTEAAPLKNTDIYPLSSDHTFKVVTNFTKVEEADNWNLMVEAIGLDVEWLPTANEQTQLLFLDEKSMPDMFMHANSLNINKINEYGQAGLLVNFMDYIDLMPNLQAWLETHPYLLDTVTDAEGNFYTLPGYSDHTTMAGNMFYVRLDQTRAAGWEELPTTIEDFLLMCEDLQNYYEDVEGYVPFAANGPNYMTYSGSIAQAFFPAFGELLKPDLTTNNDFTKIEAGFATEQFKHYITFMHTMYAEGYLDPECFVNESATTKAMTNEGKVTMHPHATQLTKENFASGELDFQVYPPLTSQYQTEARYPYPNTYVAKQFMISTTCPEIELAVQFMDAFFATRDNPLNEEGGIYCWSLELGQEGVDFVINEEEGWYQILDHEGFDSASAWLQVAGNGTAVVREWSFYENSGTGLMVKAMGHANILTPLRVETFNTGLLKLTQDEQDIYNDAWTDIKNYLTEMNAAFITGQKDIEVEWDGYIKHLYDIGLQDVIDAYQAALDRFNAK